MKRVESQSKISSTRLFETIERFGFVALLFLEIGSKLREKH